MLGAATPRKGTPFLQRLATPRRAGTWRAAEAAVGASPVEAWAGLDPEPAAPKEAWGTANPSPQLPKAPSPTGGSPGLPRPPTAEPQQVGAPSPDVSLAEISALRGSSSIRRNKVAWLLGRAPETSQPSPRLVELEAQMPDAMKTVRSTSRSYYSKEQLADAEPMSRLFLRKRDRMTEFVEVMMHQTHIIRK